MMSFGKSSKILYVSSSQEVIPPSLIQMVNTFETFSISTSMETEYTSIIMFSSLSTFLRIAKNLSDYDVIKFLRQFADEETVKCIQRLDNIKKNLRALLALILWIAEIYREYGHPSISVVFDEETNEFQFIAIILPKGDWNSWRKIASNVKDEMKRNGLEKLASKVAIICLEALQEH